MLTEIFLVFTMFDCLVYRRRSHQLYGKHHHHANRLLSGDFNRVNHLQISNPSAMDDCSIFFRNVEQLTIPYEYQLRHSPSFSITLDRIIPLKQLRKINIYCRFLSFATLTNLLYLIPNCIQLTVTSVLTGDTSLLSTLNQKNKTTNLTVKSHCTFEQVKFLTKLCSQVQHLSIVICGEELRSIIQYLLSKCNRYTSHLTSLHIQSTNDIYIEKLEDLLGSLRQSKDFFIEDLSCTCCYIWW